MTDIVERLRQRPCDIDPNDCMEAAAEIERLRDNLDKMRLTAETFAERAEEAADEIEKLREDVARMDKVIRLNNDEIERLRNELIDAGEMIFNQAKTIRSLKEKGNESTTD